MVSQVVKMAFIGLALATTSACSSTPTPDSIGYETYVQQGDMFKDTELTDSQGQAVQFAANKKKLVILFATWCSDSQRTLKELKESPLLNHPELQIVAIGREENNDSLNQFASEFGTPFTLVADPDRQIYSRYANKGIPRLLLLDEQNRVLNTWIAEAPNTINEVKW
ncbi:TlpA family protein disulfide reductase [Pseudoalteromonas fenneropenaei]|uniref:TlpA family protein disulfide reductase n=1 Tax=Pseudoalteromonas fenneropenaei TaxID=1737459 RepID=A0ABV7CPA6_9GAMM